MEIDLRESGPLALGLMRIVLGFMLVWAFLDKMFGLGFPSPSSAAVINGGSPTEYYLNVLVEGPFEGIYHALAGNAFVDFLLLAGLLAVGSAMMLGIASKLATVGSVVMMALMFTLVLPPSDNPLVDYHIVYILATLVIYWLGGYSHLGLEDRWKGLSLVKRYPILE